MALDGFHLVLSRTALLDIFLLLFVLAAFAALVIDRDTTGARWLRASRTGSTRPERVARRMPAACRGGGSLAGVLSGCASRSSGAAVYFVPVFVAADAGVGGAAPAARSASRAPGRHPARRGGWVGLSAVPGPADATSRAGPAGSSPTRLLPALARRHRPVRAAGHRRAAEPVALPPGGVQLPQRPRPSTHIYQSWPWQWLLLGRPVAFYWSNKATAARPAAPREILLLGTPLLWWSFLPALVGAGLAWRRPARLAGVRDPCSWPPACCPGSTTRYQGRTMFSFYAAPVAAVPDPGGRVCARGDRDARARLRPLGGVSQDGRTARRW